MHTHAHMQTHTHQNVHTNTTMHTYVDVDACTCTCMHMVTNTLKNIQRQTYMQFTKLAKVPAIMWPFYAFYSRLPV